MLHSSLAEFNEMVRNELRGEVLEGLGEQRAVLPYHFVMIGIAPTVSFFYFGVPWFRQTPLISPFAFGAYMLTFLVAGMPLVVAHGAWRGSQLRPLEQTRVVAAVKQHWPSYLRIALEGATGFILVWTSIAFVAPLAVANAPGLYLGLREGDALWLAVLANAPVWLMALWTYRGGSSDWERTLLKFFVAKRKSTQVVALGPLEQTLSSVQEQSEPVSRKSHSGELLVVGTWHDQKPCRGLRAAAARIDVDYA